MGDFTNQIFLPWVQPNLVRTGSNQAVDVKVFVKSLAEPVTQTVRLCGPDDVIGIDSQQVIRTDPPPGTTEFEPNYFPLVEFDRPDFPWLFTTAKANARGQLQPWLCLIVVRKQLGVQLRPSLPLSVLEITDPAKPFDELPNLAESHLWAHAQVTGSSISDLTSTLDSAPARTLPGGKR